MFGFGVPNQRHCPFCGSLGSIQEANFATHVLECSINAAKQLGVDLSKFNHQKYTIENLPMSSDDEFDEEYITDEEDFMSSEEENELKKELQDLEEDNQHIEALIDQQQTQDSAVLCIIFQFTSGYSLEGLFKPSDTLKQMKQWVSLDIGVNISGIRFIHNGQTLKDDEATLEQLKFKNKTILKCSARR